MAGHPSILVIGGASVDRLRADGQPVVTPGGGALFTAVAARKAGGNVRFFGFRPDPLPALFVQAAETVEWVGPACQLEDIPHFEIVYSANGDARLERATWGNEDTLDPSMVPDDLLDVDFIHIAAIHDPSLQMRFVDDLRRRSRAKISAGTFGYMVHRAPDAVRALSERCDLFFLNAFEADTIFGDTDPPVRPGQIMVVTRGSAGADVYQGGARTRVPCCPSTPVDLTGAGDSVCGGTLAGLAAGQHPTRAVALGAAVAAVTIEAPGMWKLLATDAAAIRDRLTGLRDRRAVVDPTQVRRMAGLVAELPEVKGFDFTGPLFPAVGDPAALDYFFAVMLHQFGFWSPSNGAYGQPTYANLDGSRLKGSDYCFAAFLRALRRNPAELGPHGQANLRWQDTETLFRADDGSVPMPVLANHHALARGYGRDMWELGWTPAALVEQARKSDRPVRWLLQALDHLSGYREDPLRKKSMLLVLALQQRPERWLDPDDQRDMSPVIDYHLMRSCLRTGLVQVRDHGLRGLLEARKIVAPADELAVRLACYEAIEALCAASGRGIGAVDWFFFGARRRCPEMTEPECAACPVDAVCAHDKAMFQPVLRTTFY